MECLNVICLERSQVRGEKSKAAERGVCQMREKRAQHAQKCAIGERREQRAEEREGRREERGVGDEKRGEESVSRARI
jgi:hypothetical protein